MSKENTSHIVSTTALHHTQHSWNAPKHLYQTRDFFGIEYALHWRHNDYDGVSNHQPHGCLLDCLFRRRWKKTSKLRVTGLCVGNSPGPVNSPHKGPVTRKMFPFDDVIMRLLISLALSMCGALHVTSHWCSALESTTPGPPSLIWFNFNLNMDK